jgi:antitoxin (DNA-binding transcriptional repressor) of toxin-antitoxin stability system
MATVTLEEAQAKLTELIHNLSPGDELVIVENRQPVAKIVAPPRQDGYPLLGRAKGMLTILAEDDEHLEDFKEYMP